VVPNENLKVPKCFHKTPCPQMKISQIRVYSVQIPFTIPINYNHKRNKQSESIVLSIHTEDGKTGYGEGTLRCYVNGDSIHENIAIFTSAYQENPVTEINNLKEIKNWCTIIYEIHQIPELVAALEIALLDLLGQYKNCSIDHFLSDKLTAPPPYTAIIPFWKDEMLEKNLDHIASMKIQDIKVKTGHKNDKERLAYIRKRLGDAVDIRIDANRAWKLHEAIKKIKCFEKYNLSSIEEPLLETHASKLGELSKNIGTPILLDESVFCLGQAATYAGKIRADKLMFNLKVSKSGGLLHTSQLYHYAKSKGIACQMGCGVGDSAILSAAGRMFAQSHQLVHLEGSFSQFFTKGDISVEPVTFGKNGIAPQLVGDGLGIEIDRQKLEKYGKCISVLGESVPD